MTGIAILLLLSTFFIVGVLFINISPEFGGSHSKEDIKRYEGSGNYSEGKFINLTTTNMDLSFKDYRSMMAFNLPLLLQGTFPEGVWETGFQHFGAHG